jgi:hypothetical protein
MNTLEQQNCSMLCQWVHDTIEAMYPERRYRRIYMQTIAVNIPPRKHYTYTACGGPQQQPDQIVLIPWVIAIPNKGLGGKTAIDTKTEAANG